jgi:hypothetical protein
MDSLNLTLSRLNDALNLTLQYFANPEVILVVVALLFIVSLSLIIVRR